MRLCWIVLIEEMYTSICGLRMSNRILCLLFGLFQISVVALSLFQHIFSWHRYRHVFFCHSNISSSATAAETFLAYDIVIFDFSLMHRVLGTSECVANYLDGGYMRALWCVQHLSALMLMIFTLYFFRRFVWLLWPSLLMQSSYALGMAVLTMATAPKLLEALSGTVDRELGVAFSAYICGLGINWLFTFILWHYYWGMENKYVLARRNPA